MPLFTTEELTSIRASMAALLPDSCDIMAISQNSDGEGGYDEVVTFPALGVACRFSMLTGIELERAGQVAAGADCVVTLPANTTVTGTGRLSVMQAEPVAAYQIEVIHVVRRSQEFTRRVYGKLLNP